jgi:hypothetical protein
MDQAAIVMDRLSRAFPALDDQQLHDAVVDALLQVGAGNVSRLYAASWRNVRNGAAWEHPQAARSRVWM